MQYFRSFFQEPTRQFFHPRSTMKSVTSPKRLTDDNGRMYPNEATLRSFCIAFRPYDKILLFPPSRENVTLIRQAVEEHWTVDNESSEDNCYTLKLSGTPFLKHTGREHAILLKCLCSVLLERLKAYGWELVLCTDLSCKTDLTAWYFRRTNPPANSPDTPDKKDTFNNSTKRSAQSVMSKTWSFVCMSLSKNRQVQLINAPGMLHHAMKQAVQANYRLGIDKEIDHGGDYEIKLNGSPWDTKNRDQILGALKTLLAVFRKFAANGFHLYGLVNLKETADSLFFEYDRSQTSANDQYFMITLDDVHLLRVVGGTLEICDVVESVLRQHWPLGFVSPREMIDSDGGGSQSSTSPPSRSLSSSAVPSGGGDASVSFEYKMKGAPWRAEASQIGESRRLITTLLDTLLEHGWTAVTGIDVSRALNSKSALLFQSCPPVTRGSVKHVCMSPLSKRNLQLTNAPESLRQLVKAEFKDIIVEENLSENETQYEIGLDGFNWDPDPNNTVSGAGDSYTFVRRRMGSLLQRLMDARWMVIASADVAHQAEAAGVGEGIHSWFLLYCGEDGNADKSVHGVLRVGARIGSVRIST